ncbi:MAG: exodeoxyribonuclease VII large subunit [Pseudomonadota bacterium]
MQQIPLAPDQIFTVSELNSEVKWLLDTQFGSIWVEGELSNTMRARTGHMYFSLKDSRSQLRCAMFRNDNRRLDFVPADGQKVLCRGRLGIYEARGDYQMVVDRMIETGAGALQQKFEQTKKRLHAEGLFDQAHKKPLPQFPQAIGVITSPTGAAIRDVLNVLKRRYNCARVIVYPATVQGQTAAPAIVKMLGIANRRSDVDVLLLIRGGGSIEDLWAFNEEAVARAVFESTVPVISGVGHEIDYTITDLVADVRAPTPSAAAELCSPDQEELLLSLRSVQRNLYRLMTNRIKDRHGRVKQWQQRLANVHPRNQLRQKAQRSDELDIRLRRCMTNTLSSAQLQHRQLSRRLRLLSPQHQIAQRHERLQRLHKRLTQSLVTQLQQAQLQLSGSQRALQAISPLNTLARGYAIVQNDQGNVVTDASQISRDDPIKVRLAQGDLAAQVTDVSAGKTAKTEST